MRKLLRRIGRRFIVTVGQGVKQARRATAAVTAGRPSAKRTPKAAAPAVAPASAVKLPPPVKPPPPPAAKPLAVAKLPPAVKAPPPAPRPWTPANYVVPPVEGKTRFHDLALPDEVLHAVADAGFKYCTPIQAQIIPHTLAGRDAAGRAQTGTGKTAAFLITIFTYLLRHPRQGPAPRAAPRVLILAPTRELVMQIEKDARVLGLHCPLRTLAVFGGIDYEKQKRTLQTANPEIVVATPGRLLDYRRGGYLDLRQVEILVIDEADRMLDMGFIPDVRTIIHAIPRRQRRQTMFFSATLTPEIMRLASSWTTDPVMIEVAPEQVEVSTVEQIVYTVSSDQKFALLYNLLEQKGLTRVLLFCNRRDETEYVVDRLKQYGIDCAMISGAVAQERRMRVLEDFREGRLRVLVATDVAGRGLHVEAISHVINYDIPYESEDYVHRIGRTGRAGATGMAVTFACENESFSLPALEAYLGHALTYVNPDPSLLKLPPPLHPRAPGASHRPSSARGRPGGPSRGRRGFPPRRGRSGRP